MLVNKSQKLDDYLDNMIQPPSHNQQLNSTLYTKKLMENKSVFADPLADWKSSILAKNFESQSRMQQTIMQSVINTNERTYPMPVPSVQAKMMQSIYHINQPQWIQKNAAGEDQPETFRPKTAPARGRSRRIELREPSIDYFKEFQARGLEEQRRKDLEVEESSEIEQYYG